MIHCKDYGLYNLSLETVIFVVRSELLWTQISSCPVRAEEELKVSTGLSLPAVVSHQLCWGLPHTQLRSQSSVFGLSSHRDFEAPSLQPPLPGIPPTFPSCWQSWTLSWFHQPARLHILHRPGGWREAKGHRHASLIHGSSPLSLTDSPSVPACFCSISRPPHSCFCFLCNTIAITIICRKDNLTQATSPILECQLGFLSVIVFLETRIIISTCIMTYPSLPILMQSSNTKQPTTQFRWDTTSMPEGTSPGPMKIMWTLESKEKSFNCMNPERLFTPLCFSTRLSKSHKIVRKIKCLHCKVHSKC